jgi:hypothetical protein
MERFFTEPIFLGKGIDMECGVFPDEWWIMLSDVVPDVSQYDIHLVLLSDREEFHGLGNSCGKNGWYGKNVAEKTEEDRTAIGKLDHRERGGIDFRFRTGGNRRSIRLRIERDQDFLSQDGRAMDDIKV